VREALDAATLPAVRKLVALAKSKDERIALDACKAILDRSLGKPAQAIEHKGEDGAPLTLTIIRTVAK
jgi:hypothetical protein